MTKHRGIFKDNIGACLKKQVYNSCVHPAITSVTETRALTTQTKNKLAAAQTKIETSMLNMAYWDRKTNIWVREKTKVTDVIEQVRRRSGRGQGTSAGYEIIDGHSISSPGNPAKGKDQRKTGETVERRTRRLLEGYHLAEDSAR